MYLSESRYPVSGSNRLACVPVCTPYDRSVLSMPATSAGVTLGT